MASLEAISSLYWRALASLPFRGASRASATVPCCWGSIISGTWVERERSQEREMQLQGRTTSKEKTTGHGVHRAPFASVPAGSVSCCPDLLRSTCVRREMLLPLSFPRRALLHW